MNGQMKSGIALAAVALLGFAGSGQAASVTGNPLTDGWVAGGNSNAPGVYVQGVGVFDFELYSTSFTLDAGSNLLGNGWQEGDLILGVGGIISGGANSDLSTSVRLVAKFGTAPTAWSPAPTAAGSFSSGHGGDGSVLLATYSPLTDATYNLNVMAGGTVHLAPLAQQLVGGAVQTVDGSIGKIIFNKDGNNLLTDWEILLNLTVLETLAPHSHYPELGDRAIVTLQRSVNANLDALVTVGGAAAVVPLPAAAWGGLALLGGLGGWRRWRSRF